MLTRVENPGKPIEAHLLECETDKPMDPLIRALRLTTAIEKAAPSIQCDVRITKKKIERSHEPYDLFITVVTVAITNRPRIGPTGRWRATIVEDETRHLVHEQIALEFWQDIAQSLLSVQLVG